MREFILCISAIVDGFMFLLWVICTPAAKRDKEDRPDIAVARTKRRIYDEQSGFTIDHVLGKRGLHFCRES